MQIFKTTYNRNLITPDSVTVEIGVERKTFRYPQERKETGEYIKNKLLENFCLLDAYVFYNCGWDMDHILYAKYTGKDE